MEVALLTKQDKTYFDLRSLEAKVISTIFSHNFNVSLEYSISIWFSISKESKTFLII